jgi:transposase
VARVPRVDCPEHGVKNVSVPWAEKSSRFTILFERLAIDVLLATQTVTGAMGLLRTSWDETWYFVQRAVRRGQDRKETKPLPRIGIDEKAFAKGHSYLTLLYNLDASTVEAISDGRDTDSGIACFSQLSAEQIASVEAVAMDMSAAYVKAAKQTIPLAENKIVHDRFHVMQLATKAVDKVRRGEHRRLILDDDNRLAKTRYIWLTSQENLSEKQRARLDDVFTLNLETGKAWAYKEMLRDLWNHDDEASATAYFKDWYKRVIHTKLKPMKKVARTIKERLTNVVSYCTHGITNGVAEGLNSKIMSIKRRVGGFRNRENFKTAIFFYCGGLDLYPR